MMGTVSFPGLGLEFQLNRIAFHVGSWPVYWYGIIIAFGFLVAIAYCYRYAGQFGVPKDRIFDFIISLVHNVLNLIFNFLSGKTGRF